MATALDRLGFHFYPDEQHFTERELAIWLPELQALGAGWVVLRGNPRRSVPEAFVRGLIDGGLQPVIHIPVEIGSVIRADLDALLQAYAHWGVRHVAVYDRPNMRRSWREADWTRPNLIDRYLDALLPVLQAQQASGLRPVLPPLEPGGDFWDTAFLQATLDSLTRRAPKALLSEIVIGLYAWSHGHPLHWGAGGPAAWPDAQPYDEAGDSEDQRGIRIFEWYGQIAQATLGFASPLIVLAGGVTPGAASASEDTTIADALAIRDLLASADDAQGVQAFAFYPLATDAQHPDNASAWYRSAASPSRLAEAFLGAAAQPTGKSVQAAALQPVAGRRYILLPADAQAASALDWPALSRMAIEGNSAMGASVDEAARCQEVVLAGLTASYPAPVLERLEASGCIVLQRHHPAGTRPGAIPPHAV
jgi:hypothetical protein